MIRQSARLQVAMVAYPYVGVSPDDSVVTAKRRRSSPPPSFGQAIVAIRRDGQTTTLNVTTDGSWTLSVSPTAADLRADAGFVTTGDAEQNAYTIAPASFA